MNLSQFFIDPINLILLLTSFIALGTILVLAKHLSEVSITPPSNPSVPANAKFNIRLKLSHKIIAFSLFISIVPLFVFGYLGYQQAKGHLITQVIDHLEFVADSKVNLVSIFFDTLKSDIRSAQDYHLIKQYLPVVSQLWESKSNSQYQLAKIALDNQLQSLRQSKNLLEVILLDTEGNLVYSTDNVHSDNDLGQPLPGEFSRAVNQGKEAISLSNPVHSQFAPSGFEMVVTAPVNDDNDQFIGLIVMAIDMGPVYDYMTDTTGLGETGETVLARKMADHFGREVGGHYASKQGEHAIFLHPLRHDPEAALVRDVYVGDDNALPMQQAAILGQNGSGISTDYRPETVVAAWRHIPELNWGLVAKIDQSEAFTYIAAIQKQMIFFAAGFLIAILIIIRIVSKSIFSPIESMTQATQKISQGDYSSRIKINSHDEIGQLANQFNNMVDAVQSAQHDLTQKIELLEKFNQVVVGREVKMVELKNEIQRLKSLNQSPMDKES